MNYSYHHRRFAYRLNYWQKIPARDVLDNPENYLGPNYKEVLNYWFYWDSLNPEQQATLRKHCKPWWELRAKSIRKAESLAVEVIGNKSTIQLEPITAELVAAHLYIERGIPFTFLPWIFDL